MKIVCILIAIGLAGAATAKDLQSLRFVGPSMRVPELEVFTGFLEDCGFPIVFERTFSKAEARVLKDGEKIIVLDPSFLSQGNTVHRSFLAAHECSHHLLGHTSKEGLNARQSNLNGIIDQELQADCMAGEILKRNGQTKTIDMIARFLFRTGPYSPGGGYPSGMRRAITIRSCADVPLGSVEFLGHSVFD